MRIENVAYGGETELSTILSNGGELVLFGITSLTPADFTETGQEPYSTFFWQGPNLPVFGSFEADNLIGTPGADRVVALSGNDVIDTGSGDDRVYAGLGDDLVHLGDGDDFASDASGDDRMFGGDGNDYLVGDLGNDSLSGGAGDDWLVGGDVDYAFTGDDLLDGGDGQDILDGGFGQDRLIGGDGADLLVGGSGNDLLQGGAGNDVLIGDLFFDDLNAYFPEALSRDRLYGGDGNDILDGGFGHNDLIGGAGRDVFILNTAVYGFAIEPTKSAPFGIATVVDFTKGDDRLSLIAGDGIHARGIGFRELDTNGDGVLTAGDGPAVRIQDFTHAGDTQSSTILTIGAGDHRGSIVLFGVTDLRAQDFVAGSSTEDNFTGYAFTSARPIFGSFENDQVTGKTGDDWIRGLAGNDAIFGSGGNDDISGGSGADVLHGDDGDDQLDGGSSNDALFGGNGDDSLVGGNGDDLLFGGDDNDRLYGGNGYDWLYGGDGDDGLSTSKGVNILTGGAGADTFTVYVNDSGRSVITDFLQGEDHLDFTAYSNRTKLPTDFADLDSNHDGVLNGTDRGFSLHDVHLGNDAASSLVFDATRYVGAGGLHLTLFGITELHPTDFSS